MPNQEIEILKLEYDLLNTEISSRVKARFAFLGLTLTLFGFIAKEIAEGNTDWLMVKLGFLFGIILVFVWARLAMLIFYAANHLAKIEARINKISSPNLAPLLTWYSQEFSRTWLMRICRKIPNKSSKVDALKHTSS